MSEPIRLSDYEDLIREVLASGGEFRLYPHGTSMLPLIRQGLDSVALRQLDRPPRKYDILFYKRADGSFVLHRVKEVTPTGLTIWGDNQYRLEYGVTDHQIIGYAAKVFREEREVNYNGFGYHMYLWLWHFKVVRRILLPIAYHFRKGKIRRC